MKKLLLVLTTFLTLSTFAGESAICTGNNQDMLTLKTEIAKVVASRSNEPMIYCKVSKRQGCFIKSENDSHLKDKCYCIKQNLHLIQNPKKLFHQGMISNPPSVVFKKHLYCEIGNIGCFIENKTLDQKPKEKQLNKSCWCAQLYGPLGGGKTKLMVRPIDEGFFTLD